MVVYLGIGQRATTVRNRISAFMSRALERDKKKLKEMNKSDENYQINLSKYAISTGALIPKGPGNSQYRYLLSQAESDFIYAIILEEYGLFMGILIPLFFYGSCGEVHPSYGIAGSRWEDSSRQDSPFLS